MKIVINECFGGFSLSKQVKIAYMEKVKERDSLATFKIVCIDSYDTVALVKNNIEIESDHDLYDKLSDEDCIVFDDDSINRTDPLLIECIEQIGLDKSSGDYSELYIEDIRKGTFYKINNYDGNESIEYRDDIDWLVAT